MTLLFSVFAFLFPLLYLPVTSEFYQFNKQWLLIFTSFTALIIYLFSLTRHKKITIRLTALDIPLLLLVFSFVLSTIFTASNKYQAISSPIGTLTLVSLFILYFLLKHIEKKEPVFISLIIGTLILSLLSLLSIKGNWTPTGSPFISFEIITVIAVMLLTSFWKLLSEKFNFSMIVHIVLLAGLLPGFLIFLYAVVNQSHPPILPAIYGWNIITEVIRSPLNFFLGVGPGNFFNAFTMGKPVSYNLTPYWMASFNYSSNVFFHLLSETGILGFVSYLYLILILIKNTFFSDKNEEKPFYIGLLVLFLLQMRFPPDISTFILLFMTVAMLDVPLARKFEYRFRYRAVPWAILGLGTLVTLSLFYLVGRNFLADLYFKKSLDGYLAEKGQEVYNNQIISLKLNPFSSRTHIAFSRINLDLAKSISGKEKMDASDKESMNKAVQTAINEAKTAISLDPSSAEAWNNLASIYRDITNFAQGALDWTLAAYEKTITLDPGNPLPRLNLGGVYYFIGKYSEAESLFRQAVKLKPDWANFHFNLSLALEAENKLPEAMSEIETTLRLLNPGSPDYIKAASVSARLKEATP